MLYVTTDCVARDTDFTLPFPESHTYKMLPDGSRARPLGRLSVLAKVNVETTFVAILSILILIPEVMYKSPPFSTPCVGRLKSAFVPVPSLSPVDAPPAIVETATELITIFLTLEL